MPNDEANCKTDRRPTVTEKPNSVCKHCRRDRSYHRLPILRCVTQDGDLLYGTFEPVAEPAEPSAPEFIHVHETLCAPDGTKYVEAFPCTAPSTEPTAEGPHVGLRDRTWRERQNRNREIENAAPQPVAGEGPRVDHRKAVEDWFKLPNHDLGFRHRSDLCEGTQIIDAAQCDYCRIITAMAAYKLYAPEGTPKLEEIARLLYAKAYKL